MKYVVLKCVHVSSLHCNYFIYMSSFGFQQRKWHAQWDTILLPSSLRFNGHHKKK
jgi:hypothetical protein